VDVATCTSPENSSTKFFWASIYLFERSRIRHAWRMSQAEQNPEARTEALPSSLEARDAASLSKLRALLIELERDLQTPSESDA